METQWKLPGLDTVACWEHTPPIPFNGAGPSSLITGHGSSELAFPGWAHSYCQLVFNGGMFWWHGLSKIVALIPTNGASSSSEPPFKKSLLLGVHFGMGQVLQQIWWKFWLLNTLNRSLISWPTGNLLSTQVGTWMVSLGGLCSMLHCQTAIMRWFIPDSAFYVPVVNMFNRKLHCDCLRTCWLPVK